MSSRFETTSATWSQLGRETRIPLVDFERLARNHWATTQFPLMDSQTLAITFWAVVLGSVPFWKVTHKISHLSLVIWSLREREASTTSCEDNRWTCWAVVHRGSTDPNLRIYEEGSNCFFDISSRFSVMLETKSERTLSIVWAMFCVEVWRCCSASPSSMVLVVASC